MSDSRPPVRIHLFAEIFTGETWVDDTVEVPRGEWEAMSPQARRQWINEAMQDHAGGLFATGWDLLGDDVGEEVA